MKPKVMCSSIQPSVTQESPLPFLGYAPRKWPTNPRSPVFPSLTFSCRTQRTQGTQRNTMSSQAKPGSFTKRSHFSSQPEQTKSTCTSASEAGTSQSGAPAFPDRKCAVQPGEARQLYQTKPFFLPTRTN